MSPRRKKEEGTEGEAAPKKRAPRKKPAPAKVEDQDQKGPAAPVFGVPVTPPPVPAAKPLPEIKVPPKPVGTPVPIKPAVSDLGAPKLTIMPDVRAGEPAHNEDLWKPPKKGDADLSMPPRILLQSRRVPPTEEVEDILEEPEEVEEEGPEREDLRPQVRMGLYRKLAFGFAALALIVGALVMYVTYARATVVVHPRKVEVRTERVLSVETQPDGADEVPGEVLEVTVAGEKSGTPSGSSVTDAVATGFATLVNETSSDQVLIPTTRLLSPEGVLFRIKARVTIPARGRFKTEVYADQPGKAGEIGPTRFTIPGLSAELQKVIYAESDAPMTGGTKATGTVSAEDIETLEKTLRDELVAQAAAELDSRVKGAWTGKALLTETMSRFVSAAPGEAIADGLTVRLTLRIRAVHFDRVKALAVVVEDLKRGLTSDRELVGVDGDAAEVAVDRADPKAGTASIRLSVVGRSSVSLGSPLFEADKLKGLDLDAVKVYFDGIEGVERIDVKFRPFWIKRMPDLKDHIRFEIEP
jgi:hypothetical protein